MTAPIRIGDRGTTLGPLKPAGRVTVNGRTLDASSEGGWIDSASEIVVVGGNIRRAIVRACSCDAERPPNDGEPLPEAKALEITPLQSPPAWVERINAVVIGLVFGVVLIPCLWLSGTPLTLYALQMPVSGAVAGRLSRAFVGYAVETAGPREDHRPRATAIALLIVLPCLIGTAVAL